MKTSTGMKTIISLAVASTLALASLTACTASKDGKTQDSANTNQTAPLANEEEPSAMKNTEFSTFSNVTITDADYSTLSDGELAVLYQYARYCQAMTEPDLATLDEIISEDMTFTHMSGKTQTKQEYLSDIEKGRLDYQAVEIQDPHVIIHGDTAELTTTTVLTANAYGAQGSWPFRNTRWFEKRDGSWIAVNTPR